MYLQLKCPKVVIILLIASSFFEYNCFAQSKTTDNNFIKVYKAQFCPVVPFASIETEISNYLICQRNVLPHRQKMSKEHLDCYDSWDTKPKYATLDSTDYDLIANYILTSGILDLSPDYTSPDTTQGLIIMKSGACSVKYVIETSSKSIELSISGANDFTLPKLLTDFDTLFKQITNRYKDKYE